MNHKQLIFASAAPPAPTLLASSTPSVPGGGGGVVLDPIVFSDPAVLDIGVYRGDTGRFRIRVVDALGADVDVSTAAWDCDVRDRPDGAVITSLTVTPVVGEVSVIEIVLTAIQSAGLPSGRLVWDLQMTLGGEVTTLVAGAIVVVADVSRSV